MAAASIGTAPSSPLNHARTLIFAKPPHQKAPTIREGLSSVWKESDAHSHKFLGRVRFFQTRFCVGIGTTRAGFGMAVGQQLFDYCRTKLNNL